MKRTVFDAATGEQRIEDVSSEEVAQAQAALNARLLKDQDANEKEEAQAAFAEMARAKLLALGLIKEEVDAILGPEPEAVDQDTDMVGA
jgi:hypothetical protein